MVAPTEVVVEPTGSERDPKWLIRKGGFTQGTRYNYKDDAVKAARKMARKANGTLKIKNTDLTVSETVDYS